LCPGISDLQFLTFLAFVTLKIVPQPPQPLSKSVANMRS
jgi:hypothetical protein